MKLIHAWTFAFGRGPPMPSNNKLLLNLWKINVTMEGFLHLRAIYQVFDAYRQYSPIFTIS